MFDVGKGSSIPFLVSHSYPILETLVKNKPYMMLCCRLEAFDLSNTLAVYLLNWRPDVEYKQLVELIDLFRIECTMLMLVRKYILGKKKTSSCFELVSNTKFPHICCDMGGQFYWIKANRTAMWTYRQCQLDSSKYNDSCQLDVRKKGKQDYSIESIKVKIMFLLPKNQKDLFWWSNWDWFKSHAVNSLEKLHRDAFNKPLLLKNMRKQTLIFNLDTYASCLSTLCIRTSRLKG